ncbi:MAG: phage portal protein [Acidobacteriia bacterium]|nr:phage portal protein [Terriglobia bacterium]
MKSPAWFRRLSALVTGKRALTVFNGAMGGRLTMDWIASILSADQEIKGNMRLLRARARELSRNNAVAKSYLKILTSNVLGEKGIGYQAQVRNNDKTLNAAFNQKIEDAWTEWGKKGNCTADGKLSFRAVQNLVLKNIATDGEVFVRSIRGFNNKHRFALQLIDADQVDHLFSRFASKTENEIRMGIEVDEWGRPVAYHVNLKHPSDLGGSLLRERIPADQILHLYDPERINQTRGITWFHPCMVEMRMLGGYVEAELVAARTGAAKMGFLEYTDPSQFVEPNPDAKYRIEAQPGVIETLPPGMKFSQWNPDHPASAFPMFVKAMLRFVASSMGVSYNALASDLEGVNYSSMRSGLLIERDQWKMLQSLMKEQMLQPIFEQWMSMALLSGSLVLDSRDPSRFLAGKWEPRGWVWVDPLKDVQAGILAIGAGLTSRDALISEQGGDVEEVFEALSEEKQLAEEYGLELTIAAKAPTVDKGPKDITTEEDEGDDAAANDGEGKKSAAGGATRLISLGRGK